MEIVSLLIKAFEAAPSMVDKRGRTPLHCACAGFRTRERERVIKVLLENDAKVVFWQDEKGRTPLSLMFDDYAEEIEEAEIKEVGVDDEGSTRRELVGKDLEECWRITLLLLRAAYHGSTMDPPPNTDCFRVVHAAVGVSECPPQFVQLVLKLNPDKVIEEDSKGNLPLHVAASAREKTVVGFDYSYSKKKRSPRRRSIGLGWHSRHGSVLDDVPNKSVIGSLLDMYPDAAFEKDKNGKLAYLLAIESGKSVKEGLMEIIQFSKDHFDDEFVGKSLLMALSDFEPKVRLETAKNGGKIISYWRNTLDSLVDDLLRGSRGEGISGLDDRRTSRDGVQSAMLTCLAEVILAGRDKITDPRGDLVEEIMDTAKGLITTEIEAVREGAAKVFGAIADWKGADTVISVFYELSIQQVTSTAIVPLGADAPPPAPTIPDTPDIIAIKHGKACLCHHILTSQAGSSLTQDHHSAMTQVIKSLMTDANDVVVRKAACRAIGGVLGRAPDTSPILKEMKSTILKRMKPTEDMDVHLELSKGLRTAVKFKTRVFSGKPGLPIMDAGLMLAMSGSPDVQQAFIQFLWYTLKVGDSHDGLHEYMNISQGENGRIMMTLVTKILEKVEDIEDDL